MATNIEAALQRLAQQLVRWWHASVANLREKHRWLWLLCAIVFASTWAAIVNGYANWITAGWWAFAHWWTKTAAKPMGQGGLVLLFYTGGFFALLFTLSFLDISPVALRRRRRKLSPEERAEIERVREMW